MEKSWRLRLKVEETLRRYRTAAQYRKMLQGQGIAASDTLMRARQGEAQALAEYNRALRAFTDLTVHGGVAEREPQALAEPAVGA
jgi:hypothetical protein